VQNHTEESLQPWPSCHDTRISPEGEIFSTMSLHQFGFSGSAPKQRKIDSDTVASSSRSDPSAAVEPLNEQGIANRTRQWPWAVYVRPAERAHDGRPQHVWRCSICEADGNLATERKWKDANDFKAHTLKKQHAQACENIEQAAQLQAAREQNAVQQVAHITSEAGNLLILILFMVLKGISLHLFSEVRPLLND
jgi:hypothetical protein